MLLVLMSKISNFSSRSFEKAGNEGLFVRDSNMMSLGWNDNIWASPSCWCFNLRTSHHIWMSHLQA